MTDRLRLRVIGWGPFGLPWERKRQQRVLEETRALLEAASHVQEQPIPADRSTDPLGSGGTQSSASASSEGVAR